MDYNRKLYFCIGAHKTGTTSLARAFQQMGFQTFLGATPYDLVNIKQLINMIKIGTDECQYQFFKDSPVNHFKYYQYLEQTFPNAKFILTIRDSDSWFQSISSWFRVHFTPPFTHAYQCNVGKKKNKNKAVEVYETRNQEIIDYFKDKKEKLLIMDLTKGDGWKELIEFCFENFKTKEFPFVNKSKK